MNRVIKDILGLLVLCTSLYAGGGKNVVPQDAPVAVVPTMLTTSSNFYVGGGIGIDSVSSYLYGPDTTISGVLRVGYDFMKYLGAEARGTYGISDSDKLGHDYSIGLYLKPQYPISDIFTVYGLVGYAQTEIGFDNEVGFNNTTTQSDFSFGAGLDYDFSDNWSIFIDAVRYIDKETTKPEGKYASKVDSFTLGVTYDF